MKVNETKVSAVTAPNRFVETNGRRLPCRSGRSILPCTPFRGHMDVWDPAFFDALAANGFQVITSTIAAPVFRMGRRHKDKGRKYD
jgi:hypothetical protein